MKQAWLYCGWLVLTALPACAAPGLLLDSGDFTRLRALSGAQPWAAAARDALVARAANWPASHVREFGLKEWSLPTEGSGWSHAYVCPDHGMRLQHKAGKNICPVDGKDHHGPPIDQVVFMMRNGDNAKAVRDLGLAFHLTGNAEYAAKARRILDAYADLYLTLPIHTNDGSTSGGNLTRGARVMSQTLSEAGWLVPLAFGYDLVRETMPADSRARFETNVLREAARVIGRYDARKSNWQSHHNAALLAVGLLTKDHDLVTKALDGPSGFKFQMRESVTPDGAWYEGAWSYHFFALEPLLMTAQMAAHAGIALPEAASLKRMFDAPLRCVFPDGSLPNFNDAASPSVDSALRLYEMGYRMFQEPRYLPWLRKSTRGIDALLWGVEKLPEGEAPPLTSDLMADAGVATLRAAGSDFTVAVKFGPHGGGHGHYDKLSFVSFANGAPQAADAGTQAYAAKTHATWDKLTVAHNTVVVDGKTQAEATGALLDWMPRAFGTALRLSAGLVYPGVQLERTLVHTAEFLLDIVEVRAVDGKPRGFDWLYHNFGSGSTALPLTPFAGLPAQAGYQHLSGARAAETASDWQAEFAQPRAKMRVWMLGAEATTVVMGTGLGQDLRVPVPFVMARRAGVAARFVTLYEPFTDAPRIRVFRQAGPGVYIVGSHEVSVGPERFAIRQMQ